MPNKKEELPKLNQKEELLKSLIKGAILNSVPGEDMMAVFVKVDVPVKWVKTLKELCNLTKLEFPPIIESFLLSFFIDGMEKASKELQEKYGSPADVVKEYMNPS